jgi:hypothetical protein
MTTLLHSIPENFFIDGTVLLSCVCCHIYQNNAAFYRSVHEKIAAATVAAFDNDLAKYAICAYWLHI